MYMGIGMIITCSLAVIFYRMLRLTLLRNTLIFSDSMLDTLN
jgi:hypothetical protein